MKTKHKKLKLKIELVPGPSWGNNLRRLLKQSDWRKIRERVCIKYKWKCGICGVKEKLFCHEVWKYDNKKHIQKLTGFIALCGMCHLIKHSGYAGIVVAEGWVSSRSLIKHFMKVNNCDKKIFKEHREKAFEAWNERSRYKWHVDFGKYKNIIKSVSKKK